MSSRKAIDRLLTLPAFATSGDVALKPGFERIEALLEGMEHPERNREIVLVAGTNGKGSTASMLAALSTAAGVRTGLHTSPHLQHVSERMRVDGTAPDEDWLGGEIARWESLFEAVQPSFFEATLALSFRWFAACDAQRWVVEIGLGGRLDAANVLDADLGILTSVGRDHMHLLGPTLADVAMEKAAIARPNKPFVVGPLPDEARHAALSVLSKTGARIIEVDPTKVVQEADDGTLALTTSRRTVDGLILPLGGEHQHLNALLALECLDQLEPAPVVSEIVRGALFNVHTLSGLRARQEWVLPDVMVDVGHNEEALRATISAFLDATVGQKCTIVMGFLADKELGSLGRWLGERVAAQGPENLKLVCVDTEGARGLSASEAAQRWTASGWEGPVLTHVDPVHMLKLERTAGQPILFGGSYRVATRVLEAI